MEALSHFNTEPVLIVVFSELCHAATKIQASFRGHQVRKQAEQVAAKEVEELSAKVCIVF